jgi:hypothetical protein
LSHLININCMLQIFAASGYEEPWGPRDQIRGQLDVYRMRLRADIGAWGQMGMDMAAGSKNGTGAGFLSSVVNRMDGRGGAGTSFCACGTQG